MIMGLGSALFETIVLEEGQTTNANLSDYNIPASDDMPRLTHDLIEREGAEIHGLGETALPPVPPAIGNAVFSLGLHLTDLPMTPERVLEAVDRRGDSRTGTEPRATAIDDLAPSVRATHGVPG
jgi:CO/xanthine dehydrogenase Mo-binding subunit